MQWPDESPEGVIRDTRLYASCIKNPYPYPTLLKPQWALGPGEWSVSIPKLLPASEDEVSIPKPSPEDEDRGPKSVPVKVQAQSQSNTTSDVPSAALFTPLQADGAHVG